jgi:hypothetical protein
MFSSNSKAQKFFTLLTPETILYRWKKAIKEYWAQTKNDSKKRGRPPIAKSIKELIREMKIDNYTWGCQRIHDELKKISIDVSRETIRKVIQDYRKSGEI